MFYLILAIFSSAIALPNIVYNPCSYESLRSVEGPATGSCSWTYRDAPLPVQEACQIGAQHLIRLRIPDSVKGKTPCTRDIVEFAEEYQNFQCEHMFASNIKEAEACKGGVQKAVTKLKKRLNAL